MAKTVRSIDRALELTPEMSAFIRGNSDAAESAPERVRAKDRTAPVTQVKRTKNRSAKPRSLAKDSAPSEQVVRAVDQPTSPAGVLAPLTTRLRIDTANALRRACLEQKLQGKKPDTQQEIIESAVRTWLVQNGHVTR